MKTYLWLLSLFIVVVFRFYLIRTNPLEDELFVWLSAILFYEFWIVLKNEEDKNEKE